MRLALLCLNFGELLGLVPQLVVVVPEDNLHLGSSLAPYLPPYFIQGPVPFITIPFSSSLTPLPYFTSRPQA